MNPIPFDEALQSSQPFVLAWRLTPPEPGKRSLSVFSLEKGGAEQVAWERYADSEVDSVTAELTARGHLVGSYDDGSDHVWVVDEQSVTVWDDKGLQLVAEDDEVRAADGVRYAREDLEVVILFVEPDKLGRGIRAELSDGRTVELISEQRWDALSNPFHDRDELIFETRWAVEVGTALCRWAGCGYDDRI